MITREEAIKIIEVAKAEVEWEAPLDYQIAFDLAIEALKQPTQQWIPVTERLPKIHQYVLLSTDCGHVLIGRMEKPDIIWQVTESDGRKHWVYDPEAYTDNIDELPKAEDISFEGIDRYTESMLSVTSLNFSNKSEGIAAWQPLPEPYKEEA